MPTQLLVAVRIGLWVNIQIHPFVWVFQGSCKSWFHCSIVLQFIQYILFHQWLYIDPLWNHWLTSPCFVQCPLSVIGHGIGRKHIPIMVRLAKERRWSKQWQTCLSSPDLTAIHNEWWLEDPSTFTPRTTERSYDILRRVSYKSQGWILDARAWQVSWRGSPTRSRLSYVCK